MKLFLNFNAVKKHMLLLMLLSFGIANAQENYILKGNVYDQNQNPLANATVKIIETNSATATDLLGNYQFNIKLNKQYTIEVSYVGYQNAIEIITIEKINTTLNFFLTPSIEQLDEVLVSAVRVNATAPVTFSNIKKEELEQRNLGQDIPIMMNYLPSVVTTSDAGAGVGYTGIRVRGSDATRVNVTINGIPYNDAESQGTFWVNMPDFTSSTQSLQLQRGVGTSTNGSGAFGASLNLLTDVISNQAFGEISSSFGSYNTQKHTVKFSTGLLSDHFEIAGRFSKIDSDGYIDRAWSDLKSYFLQTAYVDDNTLIKALTFGGHEKTYQAWYGTPMARIVGDEAGVEKYIADNWLNEAEAENLRNSDRRYNYYTYENEIDNYKQDHFQLHWNEQISNNWSTNLGLNYTKGKGYFEQFKDDEDFAYYNLTPIVVGSETIETTDIVRRRWLDNNFYVANLNATYKNNKMEFIFGTSYSDYKGDHFGEIIWAEFASNSEIRDRYYKSDSHKTDANIFGKISYHLNEKWLLFTDLQGRFVNYKTNGLTSDRNPINVNESYSFFNPKAGLTFKANKYTNFYFSYAKAHREPNRNDFENNVFTAEKLNDFELGWRYKSNGVVLNTNAYYMYYKNQLVLTGALDDVGAPIRASSGKSYRLGLEFDAQLKLSDKFEIQPNFALSSNKNKEFIANINGEVVNLGKTNLSFSPNFIASNALLFKPATNLNFSLLSKYVGKQYLSNLESAISNSDVLESYFVNDFNASYKITSLGIINSITFTALINNIFNKKYISNGYYYTYDDTWSSADSVTTIDGAGFYPQATRNFLLGVSIKF